MTKFTLILTGISTLILTVSAYAQGSEPKQHKVDETGAAAADDETDPTLPAASVPFEGMDLTWINGQSRQRDFPLQVTDKHGATILTASAFVDAYYNKNFNGPNDNTHTISSSIGRCNEVQLNQLSIGIESYYKNVIGRLWLQYGQTGSLVQDLDGTVLHGRNTSVNNLKAIREAAAGYHFDKWYGINVEAGIFMSYIGLESFVLNENWSYQRSMPCDFTPFYFQGARIQAFPTKKLKQEVWLINGWQTYSGWNQQMGIGSSTYWRPNENLQLVANFYFAGHDTRNNKELLRFHHDHSFVGRYFRSSSGRGILQAAISINNHYGFQTGGGLDRKDNYMLGTSISNRIWFAKNKLALTLRGDYVSNPGAYLAFSPSPVTANDFNDALAAGEDLKLFQATATFDIMPSDRFTFRLEYGYRDSNMPYFAGRGGTTSPDGWVDTPTASYRPDLVKSEGRLTAAVSFRL